MSETGVAAPVPAPLPATADEPRKLDDVLLAMDVVDTLRHRERIVDMELNEDAREAELISRLKDIYHAQGIDVPERILMDGVKALAEKRFSYQPPAPGLSTSLARLYVTRGKWWKGAALATALGVGGAGLYQFGYAGPQAEALARFPAEVAAMRDAVVALAADPDVDAQAQAMAADALSAHEAGNRAVAATTLARLREMDDVLRDSWTVRIVSRPDELSGVWRYHDDAPNGRNYYLIVEAIAADGTVRPVSITSSEDQKTYRVTKWGVGVPEAVYDAVASDKRDDQIIQKADIGEKPRGELDMRYSVDVTGGAIVKWN